MKINTKTKPVKMPKTVVKKLTKTTPNPKKNSLKPDKGKVSFKR